MGFAPGLGESLGISFSMPDSGESVDLEASVRWTDKLASDRALGAGVEFLNTNIKYIVLIKRLVELALEKDDKIENFGK